MEIEVRVYRNPDPRITPTNWEAFENNRNARFASVDMNDPHCVAFAKQPIKTGERFLRKSKRQ